MAVYYNNGLNGFPMVAASTGLAQYRFVTISSTGGAAYPTAGAPVAGVLYSGSTYSTEDGQICDVMPPGGIWKVAASASVLAVGDAVAASSVGYAVPSSATDYRVGTVFAGSSGGANRIISVLVDNIGTT
jgi:hypothetical protein